MSAFDLIAETRYRDWLELQSRDDYIAPPPVLSTVSRKSYESLLLDEIRATLSKAKALRPGSEHSALLTRASDLEVQLLLLLERQGMRLVADTLRRVIQRERDQLLHSDA